MAAFVVHCSEGEYYNLAVVPTDPIAPSINVAELVKQSSEDGGVGWDGGGGGVLSSTKALQVLCGLSQQVDKCVSRWFVGTNFFPSRALDARLLILLFISDFLRTRRTS